MELTESERRATEIQAAFEREQLHQCASPLHTLGASPSLQQSRAGSGGLPSGQAGGDFAPSGSAAHVASPPREERGRPSLSGQGEPQGSRSSSRNSSATHTMHAGADPRRRTIRELVAASQVWLAIKEFKSSTCCACALTGQRHGAGSLHVSAIGAGCLSQLAGSSDGRLGNVAFACPRCLSKGCSDGEPAHAGHAPPRSCFLCCCRDRRGGRASRPGRHRATPAAAARQARLLLRRRRPLQRTAGTPRGGRTVDRTRSSGMACWVAPVDPVTAGTRAWTRSPHCCRPRRCC